MGSGPMLRGGFASGGSKATTLNRRSALPVRIMRLSSTVQAQRLANISVSPSCGKLVLEELCGGRGVGNGEQFIESGNVTRRVESYEHQLMSGDE